MLPPLRRLADGSHDGGRLRPLECSLEAVVVTNAGAAADNGQDFGRRRGHQPGCLQAGIARVHNLQSGPDQDVRSQIVAMLCSGTASTRIVRMPVRKSKGTIRLHFAIEKHGYAIKTCASRGARSPGGARKVGLLPIAMVDLLTNYESRLNLKSGV